ncbi:hypothetical protein AK830_g8897 [Neonectria ditissima]|uniref:Aflatoxin biosynthesis ketoreductase nor-1 n=1 Tax=Neonectria ditissima TaxID=78410 RepID=A0A0N8H612_9HYPO|nr:hypothetical protein AK830_g8897 [Neonectria ditissima]
MSSTVVLITGASRGVGRGLLERYLARPNYTVIAANRNPDDTNSNSLQDFPKGENTSLIVVKIDSTVKTDAAEAVKHLEDQGIDHIDIIIANAAISEIYPKVAVLNTDDMQKHVVVNNFAVIWLFQATIPLLRKAAQPRFIGIGSSAGILTAALHYHCKKIHQEEPWLISFPIDPGWVQTDMGENAASLIGQEHAPTSIEESVGGLIKVFDVATRETHSGKLWEFTGKEIEAW